MPNIAMRFGTRASAASGRDFQFAEQQRMIGRVVEPRFDEFFAPAGISHGDHETGILRNRPLLRVQKIDAGETNLLGAAAQFRQRRARIRPSAKRLLQSRGRARAAPCAAVRQHGAGRDRQRS